MRFHGRYIVRWDQIEGQWKQWRRKAVHHFKNMMNDELAAIAGKYEERVGRLQGWYSIAKEEAKCEVDAYAIHASATIGLCYGMLQR